MRIQKHKTRSEFLTLGLAAAYIMLGIVATHAQVVNFDVPGATGETSLFGGGTYNLGVNYVGQGALSDPGNNYWNPVVFSGTTSSDLLSDGATGSSVTLTEAGLAGVYAGNNYGGSVTQGTPPALFTPFGYKNGGTATLTLNNVANGVYNLYVYGVNGSDTANGGSTDFTVGSTTLFTMNNANNATYGANVNASTFQENYTYVEFADISPVSGTITITAQGSGLGGNGGEIDFNGLQIEAAPEPGTFALAGVGFVFLLGFLSLKRQQMTT
jgi:hypothetical protein